MQRLALEPDEYLIDEGPNVAAGWVLTFTVEPDGRLTHVMYTRKDSAPGIVAMAKVGEDTRVFVSDEPAP